MTLAAQKAGWLYFGFGHYLVGTWPIFAIFCLAEGPGRAARLILMVNGLVGISVSSYCWDT